MLKGFSVAPILAAPPPIGNTTPNSGAFTTITASGAVTLNGNTANAIPYLNASKVLTTASSLQFNGTYFQLLSGVGIQMRNATATANWFVETSGLNLSFTSAQNGAATWSINGAERARITGDGNVVAGGSVALATTATDGFLYVPTCAGTPTGTPTAITGMAPIVVNTTNNKLYFYSGGAWRDAGP